MYKRHLPLPQKPDQTFFLWGPRQTGKTTLLKELYPEAWRVDLLQTDTLLRYMQRPATFREQVLAFDPDQMVVIDEVQKAPQLLDEIHYLIQEQNRVFVLCGSSARKIRRGHANLLGGRALKYELLGLSAREIGNDFSLEHMLNAGFLPEHYRLKNPAKRLKSYVQDYLRQEILQEGLVRNLPVFSDFLRIAAIGDTEIVNLSNIARECGISVATVREHYAILEDTLLGAFVPAYTKRPKRRTVKAPKFYFRDVGIVNHLCKRGMIRPGSELFGKAFENWVFHQLSVHSRYTEKWYDISYWRLSTGIEVDFVLGDASLAVEVKAKRTITKKDIRGLLEFKKEHPQVQHLIVISLEDHPRITQEGVMIIPYGDFFSRLWKQEWNIV